MDRLEDFTLPAALGPKPLARQSTTRDDLSAFVRRSLLDAYTTAERLAEMARSRKSDGSDLSLAGRLNTIIGLIKSGARARIYYTEHGSYDTHAEQLRTHAQLLGDLAYALQSFFDELTEAKLADRVAVMCFSEFGRRVAENGSAGTDHGTAGPVILAGAAVRPGLVSSYPRLTDLEDGDLKMAIDFRSVYATVLENWLGLPSNGFLGGAFEPLPLFRG